MMTRHEDYKLQPPPSGVDITGNIIPVADVDEKTPSRRMEDAYYLREMLCLFAGNKNRYRDSFSTDYSIRSFLSSIRVNDSMYPSNDIGNGFHLTDGDISFEGSVADSYNYKQFADRMLNTGRVANKNSTIVQMPTAGSNYYADAMRLAYFFLNKAKYFCCFPTSYEGYTSCPPLRFTHTPQTISYHSYTYDYDTGDVTRNDLTAQTAANAQRITAYPDRCYIWGVECTKSTSPNYGKFWNWSGMPQQGVVVPVEFAMNVQTAYALISYTMDYKSCQYIVPMSGAGKNFTVPFFDPSKFQKHLTYFGVDMSLCEKWSDKRIVSGGHALSMTCAIDAIFAKFDGLYTALPADWTWQPS